MKISAIAATAMLVGVAVTVFAPTNADARSRGGPSGGSRSVARTVQRPTVTRSHVTPRRTVRHESHQRHVTKKEVTHTKKEISHTKKEVLRTKKEITHTKRESTSLTRRERQTLHKLPIRKAVAGNALLKGKITVPKGIHPKLTLTHTPGSKFRPRFAPFVQRHWRKPFFWVAIAGIGFLTIPVLYYDDFYGCMGVDDPIYDDCLYILSYAAVDEDEDEVVRVRMPADAVYRYKANTAAVTKDCQACRWDRFVERKWNQSFGWVKVPEIGDVTVPDASYDRFYKFASANPPDFPQSCQVLQDAAAAEGDGEVKRVSMPSGAEYRYQAETAPRRQCTATATTCTLAPFVERKWNRAYVWVQVPETGNVTVPEDVYDRFYSYASAEPANYAAACRVLTEAAAEDTVMTSSLDTSGPE